MIKSLATLTLITSAALGIPGSVGDEALDTKSTDAKSVIAAASGVEVETYSRGFICELLKLC